MEARLSFYPPSPARKPVKCCALGYQPFTREQEHANHGIKDPLDESFDESVNWALEHYRVPGLAISVVQNGSTFAKVVLAYPLFTSFPHLVSSLLFYI